MRPDSQEIRHLRQVLCLYIRAKDEIDLICHDAGIDRGRINLDKTPELIWQQVLEEANRQIDTKLFELVKTCIPYAPKLKKDTLVARMLAEYEGPARQDPARELSGALDIQQPSILPGTVEKDAVRAPRDAESAPSRLQPDRALQFSETLQTRSSNPLRIETFETRRGLTLVRIPGGTFRIGSPESESGRSADEGPQREVYVPDFYLGRFPVTNEEYARFLREGKGLPEPAYWKDARFKDPRQPVVGVSWDEAKAFLDWADLRLPSETEWEYACRAGTTTRYYNGNSETDLGQVAWYLRKDVVCPGPVGWKTPNVFGLYDMHGNTWEWVEDDWHANYEQAPRDARAWIDHPRSSYRVCRGGSWKEAAKYARTASRTAFSTRGHLNDLGFRAALSIRSQP